MTKEMDWSTMLPELLDMIAQKHNVSYEDYIVFARVCKSWKSVAGAGATKRGYSNGPPSQFPTLLLAEKKKEKDVRELFFLSNKSIRKLRLPEASGKLCMSSCGWLLTVGKDYSTKLIHPLSRQDITLPKINTFPNFKGDSRWSQGIRKLVLPIPSSLVVVLWGCSGKLGFCRPGDKKWTNVYGWSGQIFDIAYHNSHIYSFDCKNHIRACHVYGENPITMVDVSWLPVDVYDEWIGGAYIMGWEDNKLLVVIREGMFDNVEDESCDETYKTKNFRVLMYDLDSKKWSQVKDLGRRALFVGYSSSFWVEEDSTMVIKGNCIYFTDDVSELYRGSIKGGGRDMGIYHLSDGTIEPHFTGKSRNLLTPPIWVQPM